MDKFKDMQLLVAVVEQGNFAQAAKSIGLTPAMVGRRIASLEQNLGFVLFNRSTRRMELTPGGQHYYEGCLRILSELALLEESVTSDHQISPQGGIRLSAPDAMGNLLIEAIKRFRQDYPGIRFDLNLSSTPLDLIKEHIDLSLRLAFELEDSSMVATQLGQTGFGLYTSQRYLDQRGVPSSLAELAEHDCIHMGSSRYGDVWTVIEAGKTKSFRQPWALVVPNTECLLKAVTEGLGIAMVPRLFVQDKLKQGELVELPAFARFPELALYAMYPTRKHLPHRVHLFLDFLKVWAPERLTND